MPPGEVHSIRAGAMPCTLLETQNIQDGSVKIAQ